MNSTSHSDNMIPLVGTPTKRKKIILKQWNLIGKKK